MDLPDRRVLILYGTETGNSLEKAERIDALCQRLRFRTDLAALDAVRLNDLLGGYALVVFVVATTGQGAFPANARRFWASLRRAKLPPGCLAPLRFALFGLGDSAYTKFNWAARLLRSRLLRLGAAEAYARGEGDERHEAGSDSLFAPWLAGLAAFLRGRHPLPPGLAPLPDDAPLPLRYTLAVEDAPATPAAPPGTPLPLPAAVDATVLANTRVTPPAHWQDVRLLRLAVAGLAAPPRPGDTVALFPENDPADVAWLVDRMGWAAAADRPVRLPPAGPVGRGRPEGLYPLPGGSLRQLLTRNLDLAAVPARGLLARLAPYTADPDQRARLLELAAAGPPDAAQDYYDFATRPRRTLLEVLAEFRSCRLPPEAAPAVFPVLRPRAYSIANAPAPAPDGRATLDLLVALVRYQTIIRKPREGVCSRHVRDRLPPGTRLRVQVRRSDRPPPCGPAAAARPLLAVAAGTGIAPVRSLLQDRAAAAAGAAAGDSLLVFGCRSAGADFYFADEWARTPRLAVVPAFSRDGPAKDYVQDALRRHAAAVCALLRRRPPAVVVVCGSSGRMPVAVRAALKDAAVLGGLCATADDAERLLFDGTGPGRIEYWEETW